MNVNFAVDDSISTVAISFRPSALPPQPSSVPLVVRAPPNLPSTLFISPISPVKAKSKNRLPLRPALAERSIRSRSLYAGVVRMASVLAILPAPLFEILEMWISLWSLVETIHTHSLAAYSLSFRLLRYTSVT